MAELDYVLIQCNNAIKVSSIICTKLLDLLRAELPGYKLLGLFVDS